MPNERVDSGRFVSIGQGFYLSPIAWPDKSTLLQHMTDPEIARNTLRVPYPYTEADANRWLTEREKQACDPEKIFALREPEGNLIGAIGVARMGSSPHELEFGYWIAKSYRGRGLMTRAIAAFAQHAFARLGMERVYATPFHWNIASQRALEKAGFTQDAVLEKHFLKNDVYLDGIRYVKSRDSAEALQ